MKSKRPFRKFTRCLGTHRIRGKTFEIRLAAEPLYLKTAGKKAKVEYITHHADQAVYVCPTAPTGKLPLILRAAQARSEQNAAQPAVHRDICGITIQFVPRCFYSRDGRRAAAQLQDGKRVLVSTLAEPEMRLRAIRQARRIMAEELPERENLKWRAGFEAAVAKITGGSEGAANG